MTLSATVQSTVHETREKTERRLRELAAKGRDLRAGLQGAGRQAWLAGLGVVAVAGEEGRDLFSTLVERGGERRKAGRAAVEKRIAELRERLRAAGAKVEEGAAKRTSAALGRFGIPSRQEVVTLTERLAQLSKKVESLTARA